MHRPLRILVDARPLVDPRSGGIRRVAIRVLSALIETEKNVSWTFVTTGVNRHSLPQPFTSDARVEHVHLRLPNKLRSLLSIFRISSIDRAAERATSPFDAIILPNIGFVGYMETPYAVILHDLSFLIYPKWFPRNMRLWHRLVHPQATLRRADRIFCVSETTAHDAETLLAIPRTTLRSFHPGVPQLQRMNEQNEKRQSHLNDHPVQGEQRFSTQHLSPYVLAFGENDPRKNVRTAIETVRALRKETDSAQLGLVIVGADMKRSDDEPWIQRMTNVNDPTLADIYRHASALLYPSWYEGFGLPLHEAAEYGIPCLASIHGALPETAPPGTIFLPPAKPHIWINQLRDVLHFPQAFKTTCNDLSVEPDIHTFRQWISELHQRTNSSN